MGIDAGRAVDLSGIVSRTSAAPTTAAGAARVTNGSPPSQSELMLPALSLQADDSNFSTVLDISNTVPVLVCFVLNLPTDEPMILTLTDAVAEQAGHVVMVSVDAAANPQLSASFQVSAMSAEEGGQSPVVAAVIGGRPLPLFAGRQTAEVVTQVLTQLRTVAHENGVNGIIVTPDTVSASASASPSEDAKPLAPLHQEAFDAIERADYAGAARAYERALVENPRDGMARAGLAQVSLIERIRGKSLGEVRNAAAANPDNLGAALDVADLDVSGGHVEDAFDRLLALFPNVDKADRDIIRTRLLQLFDVVGSTDPRVVAARGRLSALLY